MEGDGSTESVAVACVSVGLAGNVVVAKVCIAGGITDGGVVSTTLTAKLVVVVACELSPALQATVVVPSAKSEPLAGVQEDATGVEDASCALTLKLTYAPAELVASAVMSLAPVNDMPPSANANAGIAMKPIMRTMIFLYIGARTTIN